VVRAARVRIEDEDALRLGIVVEKTERVGEIKSFT
jgi:hypothetical protein